jgi:S-DNA-T family DNA segregation ATPase FtsK/SpoIIIE
LRESALWVFGALAFVLWLALFSYDPGDPGFSQASGSGEINNAVGRVGALIADLLFHLFGRPAYLFTIMVFYFGWMIFREQRTRQELTKLDYGIRVGGFLATLITSCALASLHFSPVGFRATAGGIVGQLVGGGLESMMKLLGASVVLFFVWVASVSVFLGISWLTVMDRIGHWCLVGWEYTRAKIGEFRDRAEGRRQQAARQDVFEAEKKRTAGRKPPRIEPVMAPLETSARAEKERQVPLFDPPSAGELPPLSSRQCHAWSNSSSRTSASMSKWSRCPRARSLPGSSSIPRRA